MYFSARQLKRVVCLVNADRSAYFQDMEDDVGGKRKGTLLGYFTSLSCPVCEERTQSGLCLACSTDQQRAAVISSCRIHRAQRSHSQLTHVSTSSILSSLCDEVNLCVIQSVCVQDYCRRNQLNSLKLGAMIGPISRKN